MSKPKSLHKGMDNYPKSSICGAIGVALTTHNWDMVNCQKCLGLKARIALGSSTVSDLYSDYLKMKAALSAAGIVVEGLRVK